MRLWHKDLITVLPRKQLLSQWRECCAIARNISVNGTPNHMLVNKVLDYPMTHLYTYGFAVAVEMRARGYKCEFKKFARYFTIPHETNIIAISEVFKPWHNDRYLRQCFYNLQEKYDCGGITESEWNLIDDKTFRSLTSVSEFNGLINDE